MLPDTDNKRRRHSEPLPTRLRFRFCCQRPEKADADGPQLMATTEAAALR
jgi:hypothetical protein